jgi:hypothetical protein
MKVSYGINVACKALNTIADGFLFSVPDGPFRHIRNSGYPLYDCIQAQFFFISSSCSLTKLFSLILKKQINATVRLPNNIYKMAARQRKPKPAFKLAKTEQEQGTEDLKKVKEQALKDLQESKEEEKEWYDQELDKNLKNQ